jgi:hypothetical protein
VFDSRVLKRIFGPKKDEVTGGLRKLQNEVLHNMGGAGCTNGEKRNGHRILVENSEIKRPWYKVPA